MILKKEKWGQPQKNQANNSNFNMIKPLLLKFVLTDWS